MTQEDFAKIFHVTRQTVSNWEHEKSYPDLQTIIQISDEFNISLDKLLKEDIQMVKKSIVIRNIKGILGSGNIYFKYCYLRNNISGCMYGAT